MVYLIILVIHLIMLTILPPAAWIGNKAVVFPLLVFNFSIYFLFFERKMVRFLQSKKISIPLIMVGAICLSSGFYFLVQQSLPWSEFVKIVLIYAIPSLMLLLTKNKLNSFHPIDFIVFLAIFIPLEINWVAVPLVYIKKLITFDGVFSVSVLFVLFTYLVNRQIDMGFSLVFDKKHWTETFILTAMLIVLEVLLGTQFHFLTFSGWHIDYKNAFILAVFMFFNAALLEEIFFRGLIYNYLAQFIGEGRLFLPLLLNTLLFGLTHLNNGGMPMFLLSSLAGFVYCLIYIRTKNIFCATFSHAMTNMVWMLFFI